MNTYTKPLPTIDKVSKPYWDSAKRHELVAQKCVECGNMMFPPTPVCNKCLSANLEWIKLSGKGKVWSYIVFHHLYYTSFGPDIPYNVTIVETDEGLKFWTNLVDIKNDDIKIDMPVEVCFEDVTDEVTLPKFRPSK